MNRPFIPDDPGVRPSTKASQYYGRLSNASIFDVPDYVPHPDPKFEQGFRYAAPVAVLLWVLIVASFWYLVHA